METDTNPDPIPAPRYEVEPLEKHDGESCFWVHSKRWHRTPCIKPNPLDHTRESRFDHTTF